MCSCGVGSIISFGGEVLALCEGGPAFVVDSENLETKGVNKFEHGGAFSAHPKIDPDTGG